MRILLTAFEAYDEWTENSSWLSLVELLRDLAPAAECQIVTRRYPVDLTELQRRLRKDLAQPLDAILHLGQAPGIACIKLEAVALNVAGLIEEQGDELAELIEEGPVAYRSRMPIGLWAEKLRDEKNPAVVSYHAGTFLCNATMYLSHHRFAQDEIRPRIGFVHLPLATEQVASLNRIRPSLPTATLAKALRILLDDLTRNATDETSPGTSQTLALHKRSSADSSSIR